MLSSKISILQKKSFELIKSFCHHQKFFLFKNTFKEALRYVFNVVILLRTVFKLKLNLKLKIDPKMCNY